MAYLQCPQCRLTVVASAYALRGDECPRCHVAMTPVASLAPRRRTPAAPGKLPSGKLPSGLMGQESGGDGTPLGA